jgi:hypothetical protein
VPQCDQAVGVGRDIAIAQIGYPGPGLGDRDHHLGRGSYAVKPPTVDCSAEYPHVRGLNRAGRARRIAHSKWARPSPPRWPKRATRSGARRDAVELPVLVGLAVRGDGVDGATSACSSTPPTRSSTPRPCGSPDP